MTTLGVVPAPVTGLQVGTAPDGPVVLRLFRPGGTRVAVLAGAGSAQLLALRAAISGAPVRVVSNRPGSWAPVQRYGTDARIAPLGASLPLDTGPMLIVDDRPSEPRSLGQAGDWQCRLDIRAPWTSSDLASFGQADLLLVGMLSADLAATARSMFDLGRAAGVLTTVQPNQVAVVARERIRLVTLDPSPAEAAALRTAT